ncbi:hypothetical protein DWQ65_07755 [Treponema phagedenis]|nr:hypothetical protein C5O78_01550 [Treponema phagedenis]QSH99955.1 hypothetical protein DWQ65_07755 [Treponema phagedenis]
MPHPNEAQAVSSFYDKNSLRFFLPLIGARHGRSLDISLSPSALRFKTRGLVVPQASKSE